MNIEQAKAVAQALHDLADAVALCYSGGVGTSVFLDAPTPLTGGIQNCGPNMTATEVLQRQEQLAKDFAARKHPTAETAAEVTVVTTARGAVLKPTEKLDYTTHVQPRALGLLKLGGTDAIKALLTKFGLTKSLQQAKPDQLPELMREIEKALAALQAAK